MTPSLGTFVAFLGMILFAVAGYYFHRQYLKEELKRVSMSSFVSDQFMNILFVFLGISFFFFSRQYKKIISDLGFYLFITEAITIHAISFLSMLALFFFVFQRVFIAKVVSSVIALILSLFYGVFIWELSDSILVTLIVFFHIITSVRIKKNWFLFMPAHVSTFVPITLISIILPELGGQQIRATYQGLPLTTIPLFLILYYGYNMIAEIPIYYQVRKEEKLELKKESQC